MKNTNGLFLVFIMIVCVPSIMEASFVENQNSIIGTTEVSTFAMTVIDYDSDGFLDLFCADYAGENRLFRNNGDGTFELIDILKMGFKTPGYDSGASWADFDHDGTPDPFISSQGQNNGMYRNRGNGTFHAFQDGIINHDGGNSFDGVYVDYDNDGWLDVFVANVVTMNAGPGTKNFLYHNNGDGTFEKITDGPIVEDMGNNATGSWADYDLDGDVDLFTPEWGKANKFYKNNGDGTFTQIVEGPLVEDAGLSISGCWADYDNDGDFDLYVANGYPDAEVDFLYQNLGNGTFQKVENSVIVQNATPSWNGSWGDCDNDGDEDLFVSTLTGANILYLNQGDGTFEEADDEPFSTAYCASANAVWIDINNDGDLDLIAQHFDIHRNILYENQGNENHWIDIELEGTVSNRSAIGAIVKVKATIFGKNVWQTRMVSASNGFRQLNNGYRIHFGLGDAIRVDSIIVQWPSGQISTRSTGDTDWIHPIREEAPVGYLRTGFNADTLQGFRKLTVQFNDQSQADPNNPINSWAWDFNGDGVIDSQELNPTFTYQSDATQSYDVSLTTSNGVTTHTFKKPAFIQLLGDVSIIEFNADRLDVGEIPSVADTSFTIYNNGESADSISIVIPEKFQTQIYPSPQTFHIAGFDSQKVELQIDPADAKLGRFNNVLLEIRSKKNLNSNSQTKRLRFKRIDTNDVSSGVQAPTHFSLEPNYPNPFNPVTQIRYSLKYNVHVRMDVSNCIGQTVRSLVNEFQDAGHYQVAWNGTDASNRPVSDGLYFCTISCTHSDVEFKSIQKMMLVK